MVGTPRTRTHRPPRPRPAQSARSVTVLVDVGDDNDAQVSIDGELLGGAAPSRGGLRVFTVTGREIGTASGYQAAANLLALHAGYRRPRTVVRGVVRGARR
jgi:hypothetical protein